VYYRANYAAEDFAVRSLLAVLLVPALFAALAPAAPVPKHLMKDRPTYYFPITVGTKWEYACGIVLIVSKVEERDGTKVVTVERVNGNKRTLDEVVEVSTGGLIRTELPMGKFERPYVLLKTPFQVGDTWMCDTAGLGAGVPASKSIHTVAGTEQVEVPAGTFETVRVDIESPPGAAAKKPKLSAWYAPNVGLVKMSEGKLDIWALKSFTPGKQ
jgi:hypothetical protein